jgi:hypothetical protein
MHSFHCGALHLLRDEISDPTPSHKVGRMMMNLRGLVLDDPEHTAHLQTLQFAAYNNTDSGGEVRIHTDEFYEA